MAALSATCFVHATTSSAHLNVRFVAPFGDRQRLRCWLPVMPTSGTFWT